MQNESQSKLCRVKKSFSTNSGKKTMETDCTGARGRNNTWYTRERERVSAAVIWSVNRTGKLLSYGHQVCLGQEWQFTVAGKPPGPAPRSREALQCVCTYTSAHICTHQNPKGQQKTKKCPVHLGFNFLHGIYWVVWLQV